MDPIDRISSLLSGAGEATNSASSRPVEGSKPFAESVREVIRSTDTDIQAAEGASASFAAGETDIVETMLAISRAELSLNEAIAFRNRFLEAYREIMSLQL
ncbi:MAG: flagellar hook-basal body complex protein FliE [Myxococcales bacterium]|nr:flagellar hook-basal body complex protein FliE [Myxococcales bacterium]